jgi:hypothetical protein
MCQVFLHQPVSYICQLVNNQVLKERGTGLVNVNNKTVNLHNQLFKLI